MGEGITPYVKTLAELENLTDAQLIEQHDWIANQRAASSVGYYLAELERRRSARREKRILLTRVIAGLTAANVVIAVALLAG